MKNIVFFIISFLLLSFDIYSQNPTTVDGTLVPQDSQNSGTSQPGTQQHQQSQQQIQQQAQPIPPATQQTLQQIIQQTQQQQQEQQQWMQQQERMIQQQNRMQNDQSIHNNNTNVAAPNNAAPNTPNRQLTPAELKIIADAHKAQQNKQAINSSAPDVYGTLLAYSEKTFNIIRETSSEFNPHYETLASSKVAKIVGNGLKGAGAGIIAYKYIASKKETPDQVEVLGSTLCLVVSVALEGPPGLLMAPVCSVAVMTLTEYFKAKREIDPLSNYKKTCKILP